MTATTSEPATLAQRLRQVIVLGLLFVTMLVLAFGVTTSIDEVLWSGRPDNRVLARSLAMVALGAPGFAVALAVAVRQLERDPTAPPGGPWRLYTTVALAASLIGVMVGAGGLLESAIRATSIDGHDVAILLVWGTLWAIHWRWLVSRFEPRGDLHMAVLTIVALVPLALGQIGILHVALTRVFDALGDRATIDVREESAVWGAIFLVGAAAWIALWLRRYESAPRTDTWHVVVVLVGVAVGFCAWLAAVARLGWLVAVWVVGDRAGQGAVVHFERASVWIAVGLTGGVAFLYHRGLLGQVPERNEPVRVAEHLVLFAALTAATIGLVGLVSGSANPDGFDINTALAGLVTLCAGGAVVARLVASMRALGQADAGPRERSSVVRRAYHLAVMGVGVAVALFAGIDALQGIFEDLLDGDASARTFLLRRGELATVATVVPILWLHQIARRQVTPAPQPAMAT
jgi:hypothetical protein